MTTVAGGRRCGSEGGSAFGIPESVARRVTMLGALALLALTAGPARAAVGYLGLGNATPATFSGSQSTVNLSLPVTLTAGTNRLMVVAVTAKFSSGPIGDSAFTSTPSTRWTVTGYYGTSTNKVIQAASSGGISATTPVTVWIGYVKEAALAAQGNATLSVTITSKGSPAITAATLSAALFQNAGGVNQLWAIADSSSASSTGTSVTLPAGGAMYGPANGAYVAAAASVSTTAAPSITPNTYTAIPATPITSPLGSAFSYKLVGATAGTDLTSAATGTAPFALAAISLNPDTFEGLGDGTPGSLLPVVAIMDPGNNTSVLAGGQGFRVVARVFSPKDASGGTQLLTAGNVSFTVDGASTTTMTFEPKYGGTTNENGFWVYPASGSTGAQVSVGSHKLQVVAANASGTVKSAPVSITGVSYGGDGNLLVRDNSSQLCSDCHTHETHWSATTGSTFGSWAVACRDCHAPHGTKNIYVVRQSVDPPAPNLPSARGGATTPAPNATSKPVVFYYETGYVTNGKVGATTAVCQACHTRTTDSVGNPLFRNSVTGIDTNHGKDASNVQQPCDACHSHETAWKPPDVTMTCHDCHGSATPRADGFSNEKMPPIDTCGNTVPTPGNTNNRTGAHSKHLPSSVPGYGSTLFAGLSACTDCHTETPAAHPPPASEKCQTGSRAPLTWGTLANGGTGWGGTASPSFTVSTQTCATVYCHGAFRNSGIAATPVWNGTVTCVSCHRNSNGTSSAPPFPHPARASDLTGNTCVDCHPSTSTPPSKTSTTHVNGALDQTSFGCSQCHGVLTTASPGVDPGTPTNAAPGATTTAKDVAGATAIGTTAVGAHLSHLAKTNFRSTVIACNQCHVVPAAGDTAHATGTSLVPTQGSRATLSFGNLANGTIQGWTSKVPTYTGSNTATFTSPAYGTTAGTCATVYCHGAFPNGPNSATGYSRTWDGSYSTTLTSTTLTCAPGASNPSTSCHGSGTDAQPATSPHTPGGWGCGGCHSSGYTWNGVTGTVDKTVHMNGKADASGGGPDCLGCHGDTAKGTRRAVRTDFTKNSHHVRGAMNTTPGYGTSGVGNNYDCVVCHMEGQIVTAAGLAADCPTGTFPTTCTNPRYHQNKKIDLRDVDVTAPAVDTLGTAFTYDVDTIGATGKPGTWGSAGGAANWQAQNQILDSFCLNCHDSNGANAIVSFRVSSETGRTNTDPYYDGVITNTYDLASRGQVVNIKDMVVAGATDLKLSTDPRPPNGVPDPPNGIYSRHAIRGKSLSLYKSTGGIPSANWNTGWNEMAVMSCADCHTNDGANTTSGNAHGSGSDYMLKDATGGATRGTGNTTYVCARCHAASPYAQGGHVPNGNYYDGRTGNGSVFGIACLNCHGGSPGNVGTAQAPTTPEGGTGISLAGFGRIHGTSSIFTNNAGGTRMAYRFTNGGSLRFYSPGTGTGAAQWQGASGACYTISTADSWSGCTAHQNKAYTKPFVRNLSY